MNEDKKIAVLGCGLWGRNVVRNFYNLNALGMVCDLDDDNLAMTRLWVLLLLPPVIHISDLLRHY